jgi:hypothetical protein
MTAVNDRFLELELRLLILRYGREMILATIVALGEQTTDDVNRDVISAERRKGGKKPLQGRQTAHRAAALFKGPAETRELVSSLVSGYTSGVFLPRLRDVERFLDHAGIPHGPLKSRPAALSKVVGALSRLSKSQLERLDEDTSSQRESDFAVLAEEIVGGRKRPPHVENPQSNLETRPPRS